MNPLWLRVLWLLVPAAVWAMGAKVPPDKLNAYMAVILLASTLLLAFPAIRINEQGRQIARIKPLLAGIETQEDRLGQLDPTSPDYEPLRRDLEDRRARLKAIETELAGAKGQWTTAVHVCLYAGYGLILGVALVRVAVAFS